MKYFFTFIFFALLTIGCGGSFERPTEEEITGRGTRPAREYDPLGAPGDKEIVPIKYPIADKMFEDTAVTMDSSASVVHYSKSDSLINAYQVFRIQLFSSNTYGPASKEVSIAQEVFDKKVYLDYEVPYYKVRVGDFIERNEAELYLPAAIEAGYNTAWVVKVALDTKSLDDIYENDDIPPIMEPDSNPLDSILFDPETVDSNGQYLEH